MLSARVAIRAFIGFLLFLLRDSSCTRSGLYAPPGVPGLRPASALPRGVLALIVALSVTRVTLQVLSPSGRGGPAGPRNHFGPELRERVEACIVPLKRG